MSKSKRDFTVGRADQPRKKTETCSLRTATWATIAHDQAAKLIAAFEKRHPFIKVSYWRSGSLGVYNKIITEARAGRIGWDVVSISTVDQMVDLTRNRIVTSYQSAERNMFSDDVKDVEGYWTGEYAKPIGLGFNTKQVTRQDAPKSYRDLLDPKWKGRKISVDNEGYQLLSGLIAAWGQEKAIDYLKRLAAQDPSPGEETPSGLS
ncbi:MAG: extracellular solute-binding protein [Deltaproteobacteria bacterium]|nr:extracellular solute-binding protein [Deltaproteobacteria bacterium]